MIKQHPTSTAHRWLIGCCVFVSITLTVVIVALWKAGKLPIIVMILLAAAAAAFKYWDLIAGVFPIGVRKYWPTAAAALLTGVTISASLLLPWGQVHQGPILRQAAPDCSSPQHAVWSIPNAVSQATRASCSGAGLEMQQLDGEIPAEIDLDQVDGHLFSQTAFQVSVRVSFENPTDTTTMAALLVQTPQDGSGGIAVALNSQGCWQLQEFPRAAGISWSCDSANAPVAIDPDQPVILAISVRDNVLYGSINGHQVVKQDDRLDPPRGAIGLMVEGLGPLPSSIIAYGEFELNAQTLPTQDASVLTARGARDGPFTPASESRVRNTYARL